MKKFSIVVPVYFEEENLPRTVPHLLGLTQQLPDYDMELIFVDDGSRDHSVDLLRVFQENHPGRIKIVKLSRNFGSFSAVQAGFSVASGDCVGMVSADLQDPPELFVQMIDYWEQGIKVVFAVRSDRRDKSLQKLLSNAFYRLVRRFAIPDYPAGGFDFLLVDQKIVREINDIREKNTNLMSLIFWLGHTYITLPYVRGKRQVGKSKWTLSKKVKLFIDTFTAFSYLPIRFLSMIGVVFTAGSFVYGIAVFLVWASGRVTVEGWTALMIFMAFTAGVQMIMLGVLGEYLWRVLDEVRRRPSYVIEQIYE
jgi:dolichol-phosphate mannosyltransferase